MSLAVGSLALLLGRESVNITTIWKIKIKIYATSTRIFPWFKKSFSVKMHSILKKKSIYIQCNPKERKQCTPKGHKQQSQTRGEACTDRYSVHIPREITPCGTNKLIPCPLMAPNHQPTKNTWHRVPTHPVIRCHNGMRIEGLGDLLSTGVCILAVSSVWFHDYYRNHRDKNHFWKPKG